MDRLVEKYPYKKLLYLTWYEAGIGHLLLFKYLKEKFSNNVYFLITQQGIMLKASTEQILRTVDDEVNKFFSAKIQELDISASSDFYEHIIQDIKQQTERWKDNRDCPYVNLVYSQKLKHSCSAMKKYGYHKPYDCWESQERERKGFCYLLVRPEHRWKQIANNVLQLVKKREVTHLKGGQQAAWPIDICYEKFIWFFLKKEFKNYQKSIQIKEKKLQNILTITIKKDIPQLSELEKEIDCLHFSYYSQKPRIDQKLDNKVIVISSLQLQKITELIYHEFGLAKLVRELRRKSQSYLLIAAMDLSELDSSYEVERSELQLKEDIRKINPSHITIIHKMGRRHTLISYQGMKFVQIKFEKPLPINISRSLKVRIPCLPKYYYWFQKDQAIYMIRSYFSVKLGDRLQQLSTFAHSSKDSFAREQIKLIHSFFSIIKQLHSREIYIGKKLPHCVYVDQKRLLFEVGQHGNRIDDIRCCDLLYRHRNNHQNSNSLDRNKNTNTFQITNIKNCQRSSLSTSSRISHDNSWGKFLIEGKNQKVQGKILQMIETMIQPNGSGDDQFGKICSYLQDCLESSNDS